MATKRMYYVWLAVISIFFIYIYMNQRSVVMIGENIRYDSIRKHPFDVLADPYHPPERTNPYLFGRDHSYQQVGFLEGSGNMLPLFGRPHPNSSNRWEYYTMNGSIKLPISIGKKTCNSDTGCPEMLSGNGDSVNVSGLGSMSSFIYDTKQLRR